MTSTDLVAAADAALRVPRQRAADSFVLHAPLELAARVGLLPHVRPDGLDAARAQIADLTRRYEAAGDPVAEPEVRDDDHATPADAAGRLVEAIDAGDLDEVDRVAAWLGRHTDATDLATLVAGPLLPRLAAAGHAPILLWLLPRVAPDGRLSPELIRGPARELARHPAWRFRWYEHVPTRPADPADLAAAIAATPHLGIPESTFIFPTMHQVDPLAGGEADAPASRATEAAVPVSRTTEAAELGVAASVLADVVGGTDIAARGAEVRRLAAWSMLLEPPDHAPYGWTHALTLAQAAIGVAGCTGEPGHALAVAASHLVGFRAALAQRPLAPAFPTDDPGIDWPASATDTTPTGAQAGDVDARTRAALDEVLDGVLAVGPTATAAAVWHAPDPVLAGVPTALATRASARRDAHLVKYTLACLDAADDDPAHQRLFLSAAASLLAWWHAVPDEE